MVLYMKIYNIYRAEIGQDNIVSHPFYSPFTVICHSTVFHLYIVTK
jgi:hypothetical protein